jgi:mevalonate kinase
MVEASAPAKLILCGEHAVVYGRPAIAVPLAEVRATAQVAAGPQGSGLRFHAPDLGRSWTAAEQPADPLVQLVLGMAGESQPDLTITISSQIPIASGMGSGAAIATALVRAIARYQGIALTAEEIAAKVYESERHFHGTPSGIDNTVVAFEQAIWFVRGRDEGRKTKDEGQSAVVSPSSFVLRPSSALIEPIAIHSPLTLVIGDTGLRSPTRLPVGAVRERWQADQATYEGYFDEIGAVAHGVRKALAEGNMAELGRLFNLNQELLEQIGVSSPELERLIGAARAAGALGAKLSGGGWGGIMVALTSTEGAPPIAEALRAAGAAGVMVTRVGTIL